MVDPPYSVKIAPQDFQTKRHPLEWSYQLEISIYIRIYSASGNSNDSGDFTICVVDPCEPSTATGTTALACPSVDAGGLGLSGGDTTYKLLGWKY